MGTFTQDLYDEAKKDGWVVISMKKDWRRIFGFDNSLADLARAISNVRLVPKADMAGLPIPGLPASRK